MNFSSSTTRIGKSCFFLWSWEKKCSLGIKNKTSNFIFNSRGCQYFFDIRGAKAEFREKYHFFRWITKTLAPAPVAAASMLPLNCEFFMYWRFEIWNDIVAFPSNDSYRNGTKELYWNQGVPNIDLSVSIWNIEAPITACFMKRGDTESFETSFGTIRNKMFVSVVSLLYRNTSFDVLIEPKQTEDQPRVFWPSLQMIPN